MFAAPPVKVEEEELEQPRARANTMPSAETEEKPDGVVLRVPSRPRPNPDNRKSGNCYSFRTNNLFQVGGLLYS